MATDEATAAVQAPTKAQLATKAEELIGAGLSGRKPAAEQPAQQPGAKPGAMTDAAAAGAATAAGKTPEKPAAGAEGGAADKPGDGAALGEDERAELARLREANAKHEAERNTVEARRKAEDFTNDFIRESTSEPNTIPFPAQFLRRMLPVTSDRAVLMKEMGTLNKVVTDTMRQCIQRGLMTVDNEGKVVYRNIGGGSPGGISLLDALPDMQRSATAAATPYDKVQAGLKSRAVQRVPRPRVDLLPHGTYGTRGDVAV